MEYFSFFLQFFQTLMANCHFQRTRAIEGLCPFIKGGSRLPLQSVKIRVVLRSSYVALVWKRSILGGNLGTFMSFFGM